MATTAQHIANEVEPDRPEKISDRLAFQEPLGGLGISRSLSPSPRAAANRHGKVGRARSLATIGSGPLVLHRSSAHRTHAGPTRNFEVCFDLRHSSSFELLKRLTVFSDHSLALRGRPTNAVITNVVFHL
jgi:hypothetical protein